ncbi:type IV toxin-antitoxin system AbiEi family antitoxin domain-containing protein [Mycolicibacterium sp.]|uniref:type IV toxin-antitoxin system AbiEi family antitoxin domain-containing protein n=1 Tax=Mycolicibacterium sp. TaxID=2320850 RepID=UPI0037CC70ED
MRSKEAEAALAIQAADQWGLFTTAQARRLGLTRKRLGQLAAAGRIIHADARGVHRFAGTPIDTEQEPLRVHWLALDAGSFAIERIHALRSGAPDAVVSHMSAATIIYRLAPADFGVLDYTVLSPRRTTLPQVRFHQTDAVDWDCVDGLPVTTVTRTIIDIFAIGTPITTLGTILTAALQRALADVEEIGRAIDPLTNGAGQQTVKAALAAVGTPETLAEGNRLLFSERR